MKGYVAQCRVRLTDVLLIDTRQQWRSTAQGNRIYQALDTQRVSIYVVKSKVDCFICRVFLFGLKFQSSTWDTVACGLLLKVSTDRQKHYNLIQLLDSHESNIQWGCDTVYPLCQFTSCSASQEWSGIQMNTVSLALTAEIASGNSYVTLFAGN